MGWTRARHNLLQGACRGGGDVGARVVNHEARAGKVRVTAIVVVVVVHAGTFKPVDTITRGCCGRQLLLLLVLSLLLLRKVAARSMLPFVMRGLG